MRRKIPLYLPGIRRRSRGRPTMPKRKHMGGSYDLVSGLRPVRQYHPFYDRLRDPVLVLLGGLGIFQSAPTMRRLPG